MNDREYEDQIMELKTTLEKVRHENDILKCNNGTLEAKIEYLKGQIEAYQYCMNCKR